jgi:hypothetical protein
MLTRKGSLALVGAAFVLLAPAQAFAAWSRSGAAAATAKATSLASAGATSVTSTAPTTATLSWPGASVGGAAVDGHDLYRKNVLSSAEGVITTGGCTATVAATSCTDTPPAGGTFTWRAKARKGLWSGPFGPASSEANVGAPSSASVTTTGNGNGALADNETLSVSFNQRMGASSICAAWTTNNADYNVNDVTISLGDNNAPGTSNDTLTMTLAPGCTTLARLGTFDLGSKAYVSSGASCNGNGSNANDLDWTAATATLTISNKANCTTSVVAASVIKYLPNTGVTNSSGTAIAASATASTANVAQF